MKDLILVSLISLMNQMTFCLETCFHYETVLKKDLIITGGNFSQLRSSSVFECAHKCAMLSVCKAFNFDLETMTCELNRNNDKESLVGRNGSVYSSIRKWPKSVFGPCTTEKCLTGHACDVDRLGRAVCRQEIVDCGMVPTVPETQVQYGGKYLHEVATYTCNDNLRSCDHGTKWQVKCGASGKWEGQFTTCKRHKWIKPSVKFSESLPCGPTDKLKVTLTGTPIRKKRFNISFTKPDFVLFIFDARFNFGTATNMLLINTENIGVWGKEVYLHDFPFVVGRKFLMELSLDLGVYKVSVNRRKVATFPERFAGEKPERLVIDESVEIHNVEISYGL